MGIFQLRLGGTLVNSKQLKRIDDRRPLDASRLALGVKDAMTIARKFSLLTTLVLSLFVGRSAAAATISSINSPGVVGAIGSDVFDNANNAETLLNAELLLDMGASETNPNGCTLQPPNNFCFQTSSTNYTGDLTGGVRVEGGSLDASGFTYALAKYDGTNAGYILYYLPDLGSTLLPQYPTGVWGNVNDTGYALSNFTGFNATTTVPEPASGVTLIVAGAGLLAFRKRKQLIR